MSDSEDEFTTAKDTSSSLNGSSNIMETSQTKCDEQNKSQNNHNDDHSNLNKINDQNEKASKPKSDKNKYVFKEWEIKQGDTITINQYLISENQSIKKLYTGSFEMKSKFTRLGGYSNDIEHSAVFSEVNGIDLTMKDGDYQIKITLGVEDIKYCAAMFHDPAFFLLIRLSDFTASLYAEELKKLQNFRKSFIYDKDGI